MAMPKDGTPILAYCINRHSEGWMVIAHNGRYWQTQPGKYGVERIVAWAKLPMVPASPTVEIEHDFHLQSYAAGGEGK